MGLKFRTEIEARPFPFRMDYRTPVMLCGSCFAENIGAIMRQLKLPVNVNPFGVVYNPVSVKLSIESLLNPTPYTESNLAFHNGLWFSYMHHSNFSSPHKEECLRSINQSIEDGAEFLSQAQFLLLTFGTARVYTHITKQMPVANCHKVTPREFDNRLLSVNEIVDEWSQLIMAMVSRTPDLRLIFTVSPVRHWKDGHWGNLLSKSTLVLAIHQLQQRYPEKVFYFPAYELLMDDLRDYRYYTDDLLHPAPFAVRYIWERFMEAAIAPETRKLFGSVDKINAAVGHKPYNPATEEHKAFARNTLRLIEEIRMAEPAIDFSEEAKYFSGLIG